MGITIKSSLTIALLCFVAISTFAKQPDWDSVHVYNDKGQVAYIEYTNAVSLEVTTHENWRKHFEYDERGNQIKKYYTNLNDQLIGDIKCGASLTMYQYDEQNRMIEDKYYDEHGEPMMHSCESVHRRVLQYDDQSRQVSETYYFLDGSIKGSVRFSYEGEMSNPYLVEFYGPGEMAIGSVAIEYDQQGREVFQTFLDANGHPRNGENAVAAKRTEYLANGTKITLLNPLGKILKENIFESSIAGSE